MVQQSQDPLDRISYRNLTDGFDVLGTPLREFTGKLEGLSTEQREFQGGGSRLYVKYSFTNVEVIASETPYDLPIVEISLPYSDRKKSVFGILAQSSLKFLPEGLDFRDTVGMTQHWKVTPGHMLWDGRQNKEVERQAWEVVGIEGAGTVKANATARAKELLDGKTLQQFNSSALSDAVIRSDVMVQQAILGKTFVQSLVDNGEVVVDSDGVHHVMAG